MTSLFLIFIAVIVSFISTLKFRLTELKAITRWIFLTALMFFSLHLFNFISFINDYSSMPVLVISAWISYVAGFFFIITAIEVLLFAREYGFN
ncbi:MAG: hypothetical protein COX63_01455, partial [Candidatus Diapherotrites archaeon CG_4_10_14_0_2_um_filter_31_5]